MPCSLHRLGCKLLFRIDAAMKPTQHLLAFIPASDCLSMSPAAHAWYLVAKVALSDMPTILKVLCTYADNNNNNNNNNAAPGTVVINNNNNNNYGGNCGGAHIPSLHCVKLYRINVTWQ